MAEVLRKSDVRLFDVLRNARNGELGVVMGFAEDKVDLAMKTGELVRFKLDGSFERAAEDEAIAFRAAVQTLRRERAKAKPKRRRAAPKTKKA